MDRLPDEVLTMIFDFLPSHVVCATAARVCRRWARLASGRVALVSNAWTLRRWRAGRGVKALLVTVREPLLPTSFLHLPCTAVLTELTIHLGMALSTMELVLLGELRLRHVDVFCRAEVLNESAVPVASRVSSFVANEPIGATVLRSLAARARLRALHMYGRAGCYPPAELLDLLHSHRARLEDLTLRCPALADDHYAAIGRCSALYSLQLYCCWGLSPRAALQLAALPRLRRLHLTGTRKCLDGGALHALVPRLPARLAELSLSASRLRDEHVAGLARRVPRLRRLELWATHMSPAGIAGLAAALPDLQELDTDAELPRRLLLALAQHPTLETVRCRLPQEKVETHLRLLEAAESHGGRVARAEREGYRAQLFYYWSQDVPPPTAPPPPPPAPPAAH